MAAAEPEEIQKARKLVQDYEQSERMRAASELVSAQQLVTEHESGKKSAGPNQLATARDIVRKNEERKAAATQQGIEDTPTLAVLLPGSGIDLARLFDSANREFFKSRIAELRGYIDGNEERHTARLRQELQGWEKAFSELKPTGKIFTGAVAVTVFEEADCFVVAYYDNSRLDHFVCSLSKVDYSRLPRVVPRKAFNATQKSVTLD